VRWPTLGEMEDFASRISARNALVPSSIMFMDGTTCRLACTEELREQNAYYSGISTVLHDQRLKKRVTDEFDFNISLIFRMEASCASVLCFRMVP
jgi:hypothetical protein